MFKKLEKNWRGNGVRYIAEYPERFFLRKSCEIDFKEVAFNQVELRVLVSYELRKLPVFFNDIEDRAAINDLSCKRTKSRTNFKNILLWARS